MGVKRLSLLCALFRRTTVFLEFEGTGFQPDRNLRMIFLRELSGFPALQWPLEPRGL